MELTLSSTGDPTHIINCQSDEGVIKFKDISIPLATTPHILESIEDEITSIHNDSLSIYITTSIQSSSSPNCNFCNKKIQMNIEPEDTKNIGKYGNEFVLISDTPQSEQLILHRDCFVDLATQLHSIVKNKPELMVSIDI